jgi:hypothetical protein
MAQYNHAFEIAFEVVSNDESGEDVTAEMLRAAIIKRAAIDNGEMLEATGAPFDTYEID